MLYFVKCNIPFFLFLQMEAAKLSWCTFFSSNCFGIYLLALFMCTPCSPLSTCCQKFRFHLFKESEECSWSVSVKSAIDFLSWANCRTFFMEMFSHSTPFLRRHFSFWKYNLKIEEKKKTAQVWTSFYICIISLATSSKKCFPLLGKNTCKVLKIQPDRVVLEIAK